MIVFLVEGLGADHHVGLGVSVLRGHGVRHLLLVRTDGHL